MSRAIALAGRVAAAYARWFVLFRRSWYSASVNLAGPSLSIVTIALASRGLGPAAYGNVVAIGAYYGWFSLISIYTTHALIPRIVADPDLSQAAKSGACALSFWLTAGLTLVATLLALVCLPLGTQWFNVGPYQNVAAVYAAVFACSYLNAVILNVSQAAGWLRQWSFINIVGSGLPVLLLLAYQFVAGAFDPLAYILLSLLASAASLAVALVLFVRNLGGLRALFRPDLGAARAMLKAGRGPWLANISGVLATFGLSTLVATKLTKVELAHYDVVLQLHFWAGTVGLCVTVPAMAEMSRLAGARDYAGMKARVRQQQASTGLVLGTAALLVFVFAEPILAALYGAEYTTGAPLLRILVLGWALNGLGGWYWFCMFALRQAWRVAPANIMFGVPTFVISLVLLNTTSLGAIGAVVARVIGLALWFVTYEISFRRALAQAQFDAP